MSRVYKDRGFIYESGPLDIASSNSHVMLQGFMEGKSKTPCAMKTIAIKTLKMKSTPTALDFYILSEGYNSGKPMEIPCSNCFVVQAVDSQEKVKLYWIYYSIWKSGVYIPFVERIGYTLSLHS
jgi:hypothetical protein